MLEKLQNNTGNGYFSQAVSEYAKSMEANSEKMGEGTPKTIAEFSEKEWEKLLDKVDSAIEEYKEDLDQRKQEALQKQQEQRESYILGTAAKEEQQFEQSVMLGGSFRVMRFMNIDSVGENSSKEPEQPDIKDTVAHITTEEAINKLLGKGKQAPYSAMADENGVIEYKGVVFQCDYDHNRLCLGDVSNLENCITVPLEDGGCLVFNRNNIDDLVKAIDMFTPKDINKIMRAIAQDAKVRQTKMEIEDQTSGVEVLEHPEDDASHTKTSDTQTKYQTEDKKREV